MQLDKLRFLASKIKRGRKDRSNMNIKIILTKHLMGSNLKYHSYLIFLDRTYIFWQATPPVHRIPNYQHSIYSCCRRIFQPYAKNCQLLHATITKWGTEGRNGAEGLSAAQQTLGVWMKLITEEWNDFEY